LRKELTSRTVGSPLRIDSVCKTLDLVFGEFLAASRFYTLDDRSKHGIELFRKPNKTWSMTPFGTVCFSCFGFFEVGVNCKTLLIRLYPIKVLVDKN
jgi:hypothetical protein